MSYWKNKEAELYYETIGDSGDYLLMIHGNALSSRMFDSHIKYFSEFFKVIVIDLPGHGKSHKTEAFSSDFYSQNALLLCQFLESMDIAKTHILGSGGGAIIALNMALHQPGLILKVIADSFPGEKIIPGNIDLIISERSHNMKKFFHRLFWKRMNGADWRKIIELDNNMLEEIRIHQKSFFNKDLSEVHNKVLMTGSEKDELIPRIHSIYQEIEAKNKNFSLSLFEEGKHPSLISNKKKFRHVAIDFLCS